MKELWDIARALEGCTRHASVHASAVVISDEPLDEYVPLYKDPKRPELITGYAMGPIEKLGLLKMDFLGLRTLTVLANTAKLLKESRGIEIDFDTLPLDDAKTYAGLAEAKTFGVFQLESSGMREALRGLRPERLEDVIAMVSLYRPGPMDLIPDFINRKQGRAKITYEHPAMQKITQETYGIMIYQEQIMQIAVEMAGFTMGEADTLRRAMGKKDRELMAKQKEKFLAGCAERKTSAAKAEKVWELMEKFAGYGFNKSHAAAYALVAYQTAYFKANYPVEFMAALLTSEMGDTDKIVKYIEECRAMGVEVKPPDVNGSSVQFSVHDDTIRFGLAAIKNVGEAAMESILKTRAADGTFTSLDDFCARVDLRLVNRRVVESLIKAGAFDSIGMARAHLLALLDAAMESGQRQQRDKAEGQGSFFDLLPAAAPAPVRAADAAAVPEWDDDQRLAFEKEVLGFYVSGHPLARFKPLVDSLGITSSSELAARPSGSKVLLYGQVTNLREIPTKSGNRMAFATLEDTDGVRRHHDLPGALQGGRRVPAVARRVAGPGESRRHGEGPGRAGRGHPVARACAGRQRTARRRATARASRTRVVCASPARATSPPYSRVSAACATSTRAACRSSFTSSSRRSKSWCGPRASPSMAAPSWRRRSRPCSGRER